MLKTVRYDFPLPSAVNGAMLGNGATGVMIWGEKNVLTHRLWKIYARSNAERSY